MRYYSYFKKQVIDLEEKLAQFQAADYLRWGTGHQMPTAWETAGIINYTDEIERLAKTPPNTK